MNEEMERWENKGGLEFLRRVGISKNHMVLDFGCRVGHYTIPAAKVVGNDGIVYAVDKEQQALNELQQKAIYLDLKNIRTINTSGRIQIDLDNDSIDVVLFYDVLHYLAKEERQKLYQEALRLLKQESSLSVYPKHTLEDGPIRQFEGLNSDDVKREIEDSGFHFKERCCGIISHDDGLNQGCVLNFVTDESYNCI